MKSRRSSFGKMAAGLLCAGLLAGLCAGAAANPAGGLQHPPLGSGGAAPLTLPAPPRDPKLKPVDVNNASRAELMKLPGIGAAEADRIVKGRPYLSKASLVSQQVLPEALYDGLRGRIVVGPVKGKAATRTAKAPGAAKAASSP